MSGTLMAAMSGGRMTRTSAGRIDQGTGTVTLIGAGPGGADWLVRPERQSEEHPDEALDALKIPKGATVARQTGSSAT